jgi:RPA family protein
MPFKRTTAIRATISDIINGTFEKNDGPHVITPDGVELKRVVVVGAVSKDPYRKEGFSSITVDDGTGTIRIKAWKSDTLLLKEVELGHIVMIIGKIREYQDEIYLIPEIIQELSDSHYMELHLLNRYHNMTKLTGKTPEIPPQATDEDIDLTKELHEQILEYIKINQTEEGVPIRQIAEFFKSHGHSTAEIHLEVIKLQEKEQIMEVQIGLYAPTTQVAKVHSN